MAEERPAKRLKRETTSASASISNDQVPAAESRSGSGNEKTESTNAAVIAKENVVGITSYVSSQQTTLTGIFKKRYTDFLVNEILPNGQVLHLRRTSIDKKPKVADRSENAQPPEPKAPGNAGDSQSKDNQNPPEQDEKPKVSDEDRAKLVEYLGEAAVKELFELFSSITSNPRKKSRDHPVVKTPFTSDRTVRTEIHQAIRRIFHSRVDSSTNHEGVLVLSAANPNFRNNHQSRVGKLSWIERGGEHCHFTLYKEMKDTMESISFLSYLMKKNPRDFQIAGTKDRRAATVQRVSVWRVEAERLAALNRNQTMRNATLGDFEYSSSGLQLGDLAGNEFVVTLRDCRLAEGNNDPERIKTSLQTALANLDAHGFLNYYGLQRFGTFAVRSDVLGLQILKGDFEGACNSILDYSEAALDENDETIGREDRARAQAIKIFRDTNSIRDALNLMPKRLSAETAVIRALGRKDNDHLGALMGLQRNMRQMYVHAYQSLVWNSAVSERWGLWGDKVVEGDLVLINEHKDTDTDNSNSNGATTTTTTVEEDSAGIDADGEVVIHPEGDDRAKGSASDFVRARALTAEQAASGRYSIFDIVLPLPGFDVIYPQNESGRDFYTRFMGQDGLDPFSMRRAQKDFSLSGSYRKMVARIGADFDVEVHAYRRDEEQFVLTDREVLMGGKRSDERRAGPGAGPREEAGLGKEALAEAEAEAQGKQEGEKKVDEVMGGGGGGEQEKEEEKTAVVLKFQLGTSQYATMVLRELSRGGLAEYKPGFSGGR